MVFLAEPEIPDSDQGPGYWSLTRYDDVMHVSRHPDLFCSGNGTNISTCRSRSRSSWAR